MRVAEDYCAEARRARIEVELRDVMKDIDRKAANLDNVGARDATSPRPLVVIPSDRPNRRNGPERLQHGRLTDIATMNNCLRAPKRIKRLRPNQTMSIRNKPNATNPI
jgi:hypothetical protein